MKRLKMDDVIEMAKNNNRDGEHTTLLVFEGKNGITAVGTSIPKGARDECREFISELVEKTQRVLMYSFMWPFRRQPE